MDWSRVCARASSSGDAATTEEALAAEARSKKPLGTHGFRAFVKEAKADRLQQEILEREQLRRQDRGIAVAREAKRQKAMQAALVPVESPGQLQPLLMEMRNVGSALQRELASAAVKTVPSPPELSEPLNKLLFANRKVMSTSVEAADMGVDRRTLREQQSDAACALVLSSAFLAGALFSRIVDLVQRGRYRLLAVFKKRRYDETPHRVSLKHADGSREQGSVVKVLQSELCLGILLLNPSVGQCFFVRLWLPTPLTALERNTASIIYAAQRRLEDMVPAMTAIARMSEHKLALVNTDSYAANFCAEHALTADEDLQDWVKSHYGCDVHRMHSCCTRQYNLLTGHVSAMIYAALSVQQGGGTRQLRQALMSVLEDRLVVQFGCPPGDDSYEKRRLCEVLDLFLGDLPSLEEGKMTKARRRRLIQRAVISHFLNADTCVEDTVLHISPEFGLDAPVVLTAMKHFLVPALLPSRPPILSRKSWTGAQEAVDYFGLLTALHNLFEPMVMIYTKTHAQPEPVPARRGAGWARVATGYRAQPEAASADFPDVDPIARPRSAHRPAGGDAETAAEPTDAAHEEGTETGDASWQAYNKKLRSRLVAWARSKPGNSLVVLRSGMQQPLRLLSDLLRRSGQEWEKAQQAKQAEGGARSYIALDACQGVLLKTFFESLQTQFEHEMTALTVSGQIRLFQVLMFRLLAVVGSCVSHYLAVPGMSYPVKLFKATLGNNDLLEDPDCVLCSLAKSFKDKYPSQEQLHGAEAQAVLQALLTMYTLDIARIEAVHSANRRVLTVKSVQVTRPNVERLSAEFVLRSNQLHRESIVDALRGLDGASWLWLASETISNFSLV